MSKFSPWVAVSAFELEQLPLPAPASMREIVALLDRKAPAAVIELAIATAYGIANAAAAA